MSALRSIARVAYGAECARHASAGGIRWQRRFLHLVRPRLANAPRGADAGTGRRTLYYVLVATTRAPRRALPEGVRRFGRRIAARTEPAVPVDRCRRDRWRVGARRAVAPRSALASRISIVIPLLVRAGTSRIGAAGTVLTWCAWGAARHGHSVRRSPRLPRTGLALVDIEALTSVGPRRGRAGRTRRALAVGRPLAL